LTEKRRNGTITKVESDRKVVQLKRERRMTVRILLYSEEPILAKGFESSFCRVEGFEILTTCTALEDLPDKIALEKPDVVLVDFTPAITFIELHELSPSMKKTRTVLWANYVSLELAFQAMNLGVRGILRKTMPVDEQAECLRKIHSGELWFGKQMTDRLIRAKRVVLSPREGQLAILLAYDFTNKDIADALGISQGTVATYLALLFKKIGVNDRFELSLFARENMTDGELPRMGATVPGFSTILLRRWTDHL
jgi:two-component system, NarL family, nitrate/nitrite response regulator NarL